VAPDPQDSAAHHLKIVKERGLELLRVHLTEQYVTLRDAGKKRQDSVENAMAWAATIVEQYSGMAHPETGAPMPWWQARQYMMEHRDQTAASAYAQAPERYRAQQAPIRGPLVPTVAAVTPQPPLPAGEAQEMP
jgi:hypothetical protein